MRDFITTMGAQSPSKSGVKSTRGTAEMGPGTSFLTEERMEEMDWDIKSFPCLHPDGKNTLWSDRLIKLGAQDYFAHHGRNRFHVDRISLIKALDDAHKTAKAHLPRRHVASHQRCRKKLQQLKQPLLLEGEPWEVIANSEQDLVASLLKSGIHVHRHYRLDSIIEQSNRRLRQARH